MLSPLDGGARCESVWSVTARLRFALGVSVVPWLAGCAVVVAWFSLADGTSPGGASRDLLAGGPALLPVVVFLLALAGTYVVDTRRFEPCFRSRFAVGFGVMVLALFTPMALGAVLAAEGGFVYASMFVMLTGYPLFAFAAGTLLNWRDTPAAQAPSFSSRTGRNTP